LHAALALAGQDVIVLDAAEVMWYRTGWWGLRAVGERVCYYVVSEDALPILRAQARYCRSSIAGKLIVATSDEASRLAAVKARAEEPTASKACARFSAEARHGAQLCVRRRLVLTDHRHPRQPRLRGCGASRDAEAAGAILFSYPPVTSGQVGDDAVEVVVVERTP
jgi:hypothetical protein